MSTWANVITRPKSPLCLDAAKVRERFFERISNLATARARKIRAEFIERFPRRRLEILFGNGSEYVQIDERMVNEDGTIQRKGGNGWQIWRGLEFIFDAINDIHEITDGYTQGCPDNITVESKKHG